MSPQIRCLLCIILLACALTLTPGTAPARGARDAQSGISALQEGDILFQQSPSSQSEAIRLATHSPWSHCGIVLKKNNTLMVFEASQRVGYTPVAAWIARGVGKRYLALRLRNTATLTGDRLRALRKAADALDGKPYDLFFEWSDKAQYCSELVWKVYKKGADITLCPLRKMREFDFSHPIVNTAMRRRYGAKIPLEQPVVAPSDLAASKLLVPVNTGSPRSSAQGRSGN